LQYRAELESIIWDLCEGYICNPDKIALELAEQHERERVKQRDHARELAALERTLAEQAKKLARAEDALVDGGLSREAYDRQVERIRAVTEPAQRKREWLRAAERSVGEMAREAKKACTLLEKLRAKEYSFEERRAIVMQLVERITVEPPSPYAEESNDCLRIDFRFHYEGPGWPRGKPVTTAEALIGLAIGVPAAWANAHVVESFLFGIKAKDPLALSLAPAVLLMAALAAGYRPAWRASRDRPLEGAAGRVATTAAMAYLLRIVRNG
jgi:hypothetical protein